MYGTLNLIVLGVGVSPVLVEVHVIGVQVNGLGIVVYGILILLQIVVGDAAVEVDERVERV